MVFGKSKIGIQYKNRSGRFVENGTILKNISVQSPKHYDGINIHKLILTLYTPTGYISVDIAVCRYGTQNGGFLSVVIGEGLAGLIIFIVGLLTFCCNRRRKIQVRIFKNLNGKFLKSMEFMEKPD